MQHYERSQDTSKRIISLFLVKIGLLVQNVSTTLYKQVKI